MPEVIEPAPSPSEATAVQDAPIRLGVGEPPNGGVARVAAGPFDPRLVAVLMLILAGVVWAAARGLDFYGLGPFNILYDLDQPPLLLLLVGGWLAHRSRRR